MAQEIVRFLKSDTAFMNIRPLRYSLVLDPNLDAGTPRASRSLRLTDAILSSYHCNEVAFYFTCSCFVYNAYLVFLPSKNLQSCCMISSRSSIQSSHLIRSGCFNA